MREGALVTLILGVAVLSGCSGGDDSFPELDRPIAAESVTAAEAAAQAPPSEPKPKPQYLGAADFSQVVDGEALESLPEAQQQVLLRNGFLITTSPHNEMYDLYEPNPAPFITSDCMFHAYHVLLADTLRNTEEAGLAKKLELIASGAHKVMRGLCEKAPAEAVPAAKNALFYWAVAHRLMDPNTRVDPAVAAEVDTPAG